MGKVPPTKPVYSLLASFGVQEPHLSPMANDRRRDIDWWKAWIEYIATQRRLENPQGYLVNRWKAGDPPPARNYYNGGIYAEYIES